MPITKTIQTTTAQILDPNGNVGNGQIIVTPSQGFEYYDGAITITVSNAPTAVAVQSGLLASSFTLQPNTGATNNPDKTYYIVEFSLNGLSQPPIFWQIDSGDPSAIEFSDVTKLPNGEVSEVDAFRNEANPLKQYILRSDAVDAATVGTASDGIGYVVRAGSDGKIDPDFIDGVLDIDADDVNITDAGAYYTGTEVETALQEVGPYLTTGMNKVEYTASNTFTVPSGVTWIYITATGGGGGGGGGAVKTGGATDLASGAGGGAGASVFRQPVEVTGGDTIVFTLGAGGAGGAELVSGSLGVATIGVAGGATTITPSGTSAPYNIVLSGGAGGSPGDTNGPAATGGSRGTGNGPSSYLTGILTSVIASATESSGYVGLYSLAGGGQLFKGGEGGASIYGRGAIGSDSAVAADALFCGVGGTGGGSRENSTAYAGAAGGGGCIIIEY